VPWKCSYQFGYLMMTRTRGFSCLAEDEIARCLPHLLQPVLRPAAAALGGDVGVALGRIEKEVVEDDLVEVPRRLANGPLSLGAIGRQLIVEGPELAAFAARGERHSALCLDAFLAEPALDPRQLLVRGEAAVAIVFDPHLVELQLRRSAGEFTLERRPVGKLLHVGHGNIDGGLEMAVGGRPRGLGGLGGNGQQRQRGDDKCQTVTPRHRLLPLAAGHRSCYRYH